MKRIKIKGNGFAETKTISMEESYSRSRGSVTVSEWTPTEVTQQQAIELLHREELSLINFSRAESGNKNPNKNGVMPIGFLFPDQVEDNIDRIAEDLARDGYISVNGYNKPYSSTKPMKNGYWFGRRKTGYLRTLNALYVDMDFGRDLDGITFDMARRFLEASYGKEIPQPSFIVSSGRGAYMIWLLKDLSGRPGLNFSNQKQFGKRRFHYTAANKQLQKTINNLAPWLQTDRIADPTRVLRLQGSEHTKTGNITTYFAYKNAEGQLPEYTLEGIAKRLKFELPERKMPKRSKVRKPRRVNGPRALAARRYNEALKVLKHRGGVAKGFRWHMLTAMAKLLKSTGIYQEQAVARIEYVAKGYCTPAYPSTDEPNDITVDKLVADVWSAEDPEVIGTIFWKYQRETLVDLFGITEELAEELNLHYLAPDSIYEANKNRPSAHKRMRAVRRAFVAVALETYPELTTADLYDKYLKLVEEEGNELLVSLSTFRRTVREIKAQNCYEILSVEEAIAVDTVWKEKEEAITPQTSNTYDYQATVIECKQAISEGKIPQAQNSTQNSQKPVSSPAPKRESEIDKLREALLHSDLRVKSPPRPPQKKQNPHSKGLAYPSNAPPYFL